MRKRIAILLACLMLLSTTACSSGGSLSPDVSATPTPTPIPDAPYEVLAKGGRKVANSNCLSIDYLEDGGSVTATMTFASGSERNGTDQSMASCVPEYRAYMTGTPARFVVEFFELDYWDYDRTMDLGSAQDLLYGVFKQFQTNDNRFRVIFQLKENAEVSVKESGGTLSITFTPGETDGAAKWYVTADALTAFSEGLADDCGLFPTMCVDAGKTTLISDPFETKEEAQSFADSLPDTVYEGVGDGGVGVQTLAGNNLPDWSTVDVNAKIYDTSVVEIDGNPETLPVVMDDGIYLCSSPDGNTSVFSRAVRSEGGEGSEEESEELWAITDGGEPEQLTEADFSSIASAEYSPDGRKLAILERAEDLSYLYVLDLDTDTLTNISDYGLGKMTTRFIWDLLGSEIYVMSGNDSLQLMKYDFTITDESQRVTLVEDAEIEDGDLAFYNGDLYFSNPDNDGTGKIYKIKPEGGLRAELTTGDSFAISPDGRYMAIQESFGIGEEGDETQNNTSIKVRSMTTGEETYLVKDKYVVSFEWGQSGLLYYTEGSDSSLDEEYGFSLYSYDMDSGETAKCADMITSDFRVTPDPAVIYIPYYYVDDTTNLRATYKLELRG